MSSSADPHRLRPTVQEQSDILAEQRGQCLYCGNVFGDVVVRHKTGKHTVLKLHWDHLIPWVYSQDGRAQNFVASCHVCNGIKGSLVFETITEVRDYVQKQWRAKLIELATEYQVR